MQNQIQLVPTKSSSVYNVQLNLALQTRYIGKISGDCYQRKSKHHSTSSIKQTASVLIMN